MRNWCQHAATATSRVFPALFAAFLWVVAASGALAGPTIGFPGTNPPSPYSPGYGTGLGGTAVTISGAGFTGTLVTVLFDGRPATNVIVHNDTSLTATTPAQASHHGGSVEVTVTVDGISDTYPAFDYVNGRYGFNYSDPQPGVAYITPASGPAAGGTAVTITGRWFTGASAVLFGGQFGSGGTPALGYDVVDDETITAVAPAGTGTADIYVVNPTGTANCACAFGGAAVPAAFTYIPAPVVTVLQAMTYQGVEYIGYGGGNFVTLTGTGFTDATSVQFGATPANSFTVIDDSHISATSPAGPLGTSVDVTVTTPGGTSATGHSVTFGNTAQPGVTSISPASGPTTGATAVTITGDHLIGATSVEFGGDGNGSVHGTPATSYTVVDDGTITAIAPAGTGTVKIFVRDSIGVANSDSFAPSFTYYAAPTVTSLQTFRYKGVDYVDYRGTNTVYIHGTGLAGTTDVLFGTVPATSIHVQDDTYIWVTPPAGPVGTSVDVIVTTPGGTSATGHRVTYGSGTQPGITDVSPATGPATGGTLVTITGSEFTAASGVYFGGTMSLDGTPATSFTVVSNNTVTAIAPPGTGTVNVFVVNTIGVSNCPCDGAVEAFTYLPVPIVTKLVRNGGATAGGDTVVLTGTGFTDATDVDFGGTPAASFTVDSDTQITAVSPAGTGAVNVIVTTPVIASTATSASLFYYGALQPGVTSVTPSSGPEAGGTIVTIAGSSFAGTSSVLFGTVEAASFSVINDSEISAVSPPGTGTVDIVIDGPCCTSTANGSFTYIPPGPPQDSLNAELVQEQLTAFVARTSGAAISGAIANGIALGLSSGSTIDVGVQSAFFAYAPQASSVNALAGLVEGSGQTVDSLSPWSLWLDVKGTGLLGGGNGQQLNLTGGVGYRFFDGFVAGVVGGVEQFDYTSTAPAGRLSGTGRSLGGYLGWRFSENGMLDAAIVWSALDYDIASGLANGSFDASRRLLTSGVTGDFELGDNLTVSPSARVYALWEDQDGWTDSLATPHDARSFMNGTASGGVTLSGNWMPSDGLILLPYVGVFADYQFDDGTGTMVQGLVARLKSGVRLKFDGGASVDIGGELGGLGSAQTSWSLNAGVNGGF